MLLYIFDFILINYTRGLSQLSYTRLVAMSYYPDDDDERKTLKRKMIYALVARDNDVLVEHTFKGLTGNFSVVTRALLKRLPDQSQMSLRHNDYSFHYIISSSNIIYLCMADLTFDRLQCFSFLKQVQQQFERKYGDKAQTAIAYAFNSDFKSVLSQYMSDVNTRPTKMEAVQSSLDEVKDVMVRNIEHVLENGEAIDLLVDKSTVCL